MNYLVSKEMWDSTSVPQRVINCHSVGLEGKVAGKEWESLTPDERLALSGTVSILNLLGAGASAVEPVETEEARQARQEYRDKLAAGMRSVTSEIVQKILSKGG